MRLQLNSKNLIKFTAAGLVLLVGLILILYFINNSNSKSIGNNLSGELKKGSRVIDISVKNSSALPNEIFIKEGEEVELVLDNQGAASCAETLFGNNLFDKPIVLGEVGEKVTQKFHAPESGQYAITCAMGMFNLKVNVL